jgi:hypothetical protein
VFINSHTLFRRSLELKTPAGIPVFMPLLACHFGPTGKRYMVHKDATYAKSQGQFMNMKGEKISDEGFFL